MSVVLVALIVCAVAMPLLSIVAALVSDDLQVAASVMSTVLPSSNVPIAVNDWVWPELMDALVGLIAIDRRLATVIVTLVEPLLAAEVAVTLIVPVAIPVTKPPSETVALELSDEDQLTEPVVSFVLPSL